MSGMSKAHALVVGIANYQHVEKLPTTVLKDAQDIYDLLIAPYYCGYVSDNVQLLVPFQHGFDKLSSCGKLEANLPLQEESNVQKNLYC